MKIRRAYLLPVVLLLTVSGILPPTANARPSWPSQLICSKTIWPEVLGMKGVSARNYILASGPQCDWDVRILLAGAVTTLECRPNRICLFLNKNGFVRMVPVLCVP
ncbi:hypothetical protein CLOM_g22976 [Closterium sp. NIES-68]|nr:hypothetical protein CLOM_g22976 [Closterium sp. NIES-68]GJP61134.1 hypothetical protein CLOP_g18334 [Closterium sp. NIES-67]